MIRFSGWYIAWWVVLALPASGQTSAPVGKGLQGAYYVGRDFEQYVLTRRDASINFDWHGRHPVGGVGAEQFSVRWTGWLVPPFTGRYVLHLSVDDGVRLWVNERLLLDDWRDQGLSYYQIAVELHAGQAYPVRLDYGQATAATRVQLAWELPVTQLASDKERNRKRATADKGEAVVIPTRYLFSEAPLLPPVPTLAEVAASHPPVRQPIAPPSLLARQMGAEALAKPRLRSYLPSVVSTLAPPASARVDSRQTPTTLAIRLRACLEIG